MEHVKKVYVVIPKLNNNSCESLARGELQELLKTCISSILDGISAVIKAKGGISSIQYK